MSAKSLLSRSCFALAPALQALVPSAGLAVAALTITAPAAHAQVTGYNDLNAFNAAATTSATYDFEGIAPAGSRVTSPSLAPLTVTVNSGSYLVASRTANGGSYSLNGTDSLLGAVSFAMDSDFGTTTLDFGGSYTAFGTEFGFRPGGSTGLVSVQLFNGTTAVGNAFSSAASTTSTFIGLTSTQAFDRATFTTVAQPAVAGQVFDNVRVGFIGIATAAPEPGTIALLLTAGVPLVGIVCRRTAAK